MKFKIMKAAFAIACVVVAGMGCFKAYGSSSQSKEGMLLAENVEALSDKEPGKEEGDEKFDYVITKESCSFTVDIHFSIPKLRAYFPNATYGMTIDATELTTLYSKIPWYDFWSRGVRLGKDCNCQCVQAKFRLK